METENKKISLDEVLRILWIESIGNKEPDSTSDELKLILDANYDSQMNDIKKQLLLDKLYSNLTINTLGKLIHTKISEKSISNENISKGTNIPISTIEGLESDSVYPNNIPAVLFIKFLRLLNISMNELKDTIWNTYEVLNKRKLMSNKYPALQVSFRRIGSESAKHYQDVGNSNSSKELFENKESLNKYLSLLENLLEENKNGNSNI